MYVLKLTAATLRKDNADAFEKAAMRIDGVKKAEMWPGAAEISMSGPKTAPAVLAALREAGFVVIVEEPARSNTSLDVRIDGMTCRACEITVERRFKKVPGVKKVDVNAAKGIATITMAGKSAPDLDELQKLVAKDGYVIRGASSAGVSLAVRPSLLRLAGLFGAVLILGTLLSKLGVFHQSYQTGGSITFLSALLVGLVAGSSSCMAVAGGLMLGTAAKFSEAYGGSTPMSRMKPVFMFVSGRVISYGLLGGVIGTIGQALTPSPLITGIITVAAAVYMLIMGLDMLRIAPRWLTGLLPRMPKAFSHRMIDAEGKTHPVMPFILGAATFFIPCGFTQSFQVYALTTGSFAGGALVLTGFALGTVPALLALGCASNALKGKAGNLFFQFSGTLVVVLGVWNMQNGFTVAGHPLSLSSMLPKLHAVETAQAVDDPNVVFDGKTQLIKMKLGIDPFYSPSDEFTVRAGYPVRMEISGIGTGCRSVFQIPKFGVQVSLNQPINIVEFTPDKSGDTTFSCSMGMFRGTLHVVSRS